MDKKRSIGVTLVAIYFFVGGLGGLLVLAPNFLPPLYRMISMILSVASIVSGIGLFTLRSWGLKGSVIVILLGTTWSVAYNSPLFLGTRIHMLEQRYLRIQADNPSLVHYELNNKQVTKEEFLRHMEKRIDRERKRGFDWAMILLPNIQNALLLFFFSRRRIKAQFQSTEPAA